ncbi:fumarylacetoacetate hydrolase family protein [Terriglobus aquaticus]|uniref:Fumarylacetoacetate hydrolase family protein n=1 Tax=Terriglobus aquaticus TaxID=940139 RepID=A0ABW9KGQ4_9BACT|nr:fumarylacetoacetate hydrolase family protein [Terriglobus aquaticus]
MKLYNTRRGILLTEDDSTFYTLGVGSWDDVLTSDDLPALCAAAISGPVVTAPTDEALLAPIGSQEVWAAGVTYFRSRSARIEESKDAGGGTFYDRVYEAERPELFFKATARRVIAPGGNVRVRSDAKWSVPEPELTLVINPKGEIVGYTIGNDMSSRDIEGENPLYLPQAKVYDGSCSIGPRVLLSPEPLAKSTAIRLTITRAGEPAFQGETTLAELKRDPQELVGYLYRDNSFPAGALLLTGTGIVPADDFTLQSGDVVEITIDPIGTLRNTVA